MKIKFISGCSIGKPNLILLSVNNEGAVFDCGYQYEMPDFTKIDKEVKHIFITHAHADHVGSITILKRMFPDANVYMSEPTKELSKITISNLEIKQKYKIPKKEIDEIIETVNFVKEGEIIKISDNIKVLPVQAGHILGALSYLIRIDSELILYTGDISLMNLPLAGQFFLPQIGTDLIISESNFSLGEETFFKNMEKIIQLISNTIKLKGKVIMPIPAIGRAQEIATYLASKILSNELPRVNIFIDGSVRDAFKIYDRYYPMLKGYLKDIYLNVKSAGLIKEVSDAIRKDIIKSEQPYVVLTTPANLRHGPSLIYVQEYILDERSTVIFTGKVEEKSIAKKLLMARRGELIDFEGVALGKRCNVHLLEINEHGNVSDYLQLIKKSSVKGIILTHGNDLTKEFLSNIFAKDFQNIYLSIPKELDEIDLVLTLKVCKKMQVMEEEVLDFLIERMNKEFKGLLDKRKSINEEEIIKWLENQEVLYEIKNHEKVKSVFFIAFRYAVKYSYKDNAVDFTYPAFILENLGNILEKIHGKNTVRMLFNQLNETLPKFFKNLILKGGTMKAQLNIEISSLPKLKETLKSFEENFSRFNIKAPSIEEIKKLCEEEVKVNPNLKSIYERVFKEI
jgi:Cft2 family RNA processing exonuclease